MKNTALGHFKQNKMELKENTNIVLGALPLGAQIGCQPDPIGTKIATWAPDIYHRWPPWSTGAPVVPWGALGHSRAPEEIHSAESERLCLSRLV